MSEQIQNAVTNIVNKALLWKLVFLEFLIGLAITEGTIWQTAMSNTDWDALNRHDQHIMEIGMWMAGLAYTRAFLSKAVANIAKGDTMPPELPGDTQIFQRTDTVRQTVQTSSLTPAPQSDTPIRETESKL